MPGKSYLILGGGSAGCVVASRLSEVPDNRVTLVEAGRDLSIKDMGNEIRSRYPGRVYLRSENIWPDIAAFYGPVKGAQEERPTRLYEQARLLGGGSAINALVANRGAPGDYDDWEERGASGWNWASVLPYFKKLESDRDIDGEYHGQVGPIPIRRISEDKMTPFTTSVCDAAVALGYEKHSDQNGFWQDGVFRGAIAKSDSGHRVPTSVAYLSEEVRGRRNLDILTGHRAVSITFAGTSATGAIVSTSDNRSDVKSLTADETTVCCGAINSPALLMRSGIGPEAELRSIGAPIVADSPGVGQHLMEHPSIAVSTYLPRSARQHDLDEHHDHSILRFSSGADSSPEGDMHIAMIARSAWHSIGQRLGTLFIWVNKPHSRGSISLRSSDPSDAPVVDLNLLSDSRDLERLKSGFRKAAEILLHPIVAKHTGTVFPAAYSKRVAQIAGDGMFNATQRGIFSLMLDLAGPMRSWMIHSLVTRGLRLSALLENDGQLSEFVSNNVAGVWHPTCTCRMGAASDKYAVTDHRGMVRGVTALRICDASIMPSIPRANTNIPTIMIAERISDLIKKER